MDPRYVTFTFGGADDRIENARTLKYVRLLFFFSNTNVSSQFIRTVKYLHLKKDMTKKTFINNESLLHNYSSKMIYCININCINSIKQCNKINEIFVCIILKEKTLFWH